MRTLLPGAAEKAAEATYFIGGTRWVSALTERDEDARPLDRAAGAREPRERGHAFGRNGGVRRHPVVGLAVPRRQIERFDLGRGEAERVDEGSAPSRCRGRRRRA